MALPAEIVGLRDRTLAELTAAHEYYGDTVIAWKLVQDLIAGGHQFANVNSVTGTQTNHAELATRSYTYVFGQLHEMTFQQFVAVFESFFSDLLRLWLTTHPRSLGKKPVDFRIVLELATKEAITDWVVTEELTKVFYKRPTEWFDYLTDMFGFNVGLPTSEDVGALSEAKATRDLLVHNRGLVNTRYLEKAGTLARFPIGERVEITEEYHQKTWLLLRRIVISLADAALAKSV